MRVLFGAEHQSAPLQVLDDGRIGILDEDTPPGRDL